MSTQPKTFLTPEQYLEIERVADSKSEYYQGEMFAMAGASWAHTVITDNLVAALHGQLRRGPCTVTSRDLRVCVGDTGLYTYPDVAVVRGQPQFAGPKPDTVLNPSVIIEVLSPSTEAFDRGRKFACYRRLDSLTDYILVSTDSPQVDHYTRGTDGRWLLTSAAGLTSSVRIQSINCQVELASVYERVDFETSTPSLPESA